jgi:hypothetical protein
MTGCRISFTYRPATGGGCKPLSAHAETVSQECKPFSARAETILQGCKPLSEHSDANFFSPICCFPKNTIFALSLVNKMEIIIYGGNCGKTCEAVRAGTKSKY